MKTMAKTVAGIKGRWQIEELIGKGDAGEVWLVSRENQTQLAVMKRPVQVSTGGRIIRQASQIENEGRILEILGGLHIQCAGVTLNTPELLDASIPGTSQTAAYFIVSQQVAGISLAYLLRQILDGAKKFPHLVLLRIIASLFALFEVIHKKAVLWNDVKADHIYWDEDSKTVSIIDWGNGIILGDAYQAPNGRITPLDDYHQLVNEIGQILKVAAPDLLWDLGWPLNGINALDEIEIDLLRKRVEYTESYLELRLVEYHGLEETFLQRLESLETLQALIDTQNAIHQLGEQVDKSAMLQAASTLFLKYAKIGESQGCQSVYALVSEHLSGNLDARWQIIAAILAIPDDKKSPSLCMVVQHIFDQTWAPALWGLYNLVDHKEIPAWWLSLSYKIRQQALPPGCGQTVPGLLLKELADEVHVKLIQHRLSKDNANIIPALASLSEKLDSIVKAWYTIESGKLLGDDLLALREILPALSALGIRISQPLTQSLSGMQVALRQVFRAWSAGEIQQMRQGIQKLFLWDPAFELLVTLDNSLEAMDTWIKQLYHGPQRDQPVISFFQSLLENRMPVEQYLGEPQWLKELLILLRVPADSSDLTDIQRIARRFDLPFPWLFQPNRVLLPESPKSVQEPLSTIQLSALTAFHQALIIGEGQAQAYQRILSELPRFAPIYARLKHAFEEVLSLIPAGDLALDASSIPLEDQPRMETALEVLASLKAWRLQLAQGNLTNARDALVVEQPWRIVTACIQAQRTWQDAVMPVLAGLKQKRWAFAAQIGRGEMEDLQPLFFCASAMQEVDTIWARLLAGGINLTLSEQIADKLSKAQQALFLFWKNMEDSDQAGMRLLGSYFQPDLSGINQHLMLMARHARTVQHAQEILTRPEMAQTRLALNSAGDLMFGLLKLNEGLQEAEKESIIQVWQHQYAILLNQPDKLSESLPSLDENHPLYGWFQSLASRDIDFLIL